MNRDQPLCNISHEGLGLVTEPDIQVPEIPGLKQEMTECPPDERSKLVKLRVAAPPTRHTPILLGPSIRPIRV